MKKIMIFSIILMLIIAVPSGRCLAAEPIGVDVWVDIENGGTAVMTNENNSPPPEESRITVEPDSTEVFHIVFTEPGTFSYTVRVEPDERDIEFDTSVYTLQVYVLEEDGVLRSTVVVYNYYSGEKYAPYDPQSGEPLTVAFSNSPDKPEDSPVVGPDDPHGGGNGGSGTSSGQPKTGDDTMLALYLIAAILASAGLFALSILYYIFVDKFIARKS